jgi:preprotein translocase subunit YajC
MAPQGGSGGGGSFISTLVMFSLIILIFYFMILRPQQKRQKDRQKLLDSVKKGDKVVTIGGAHGTVMGLDDKVAIIEIADGVKVKYDRTAISSVNRPEEAVGKTQP